jgi:hypothetical protein
MEMYEAPFAVDANNAMPILEGTHPTNPWTLTIDDMQR